MKAFTKKLVLENGREFYGYGFGADREVIHEIVFNTSVVGYQEIMSDPAYADQMVVMTYPLIGNYGMADEDYETKTPSIGAMIVREYNDQPSNFRYTRTLSEVLEECNIPAIEGLDTRALTRIIRDEGTQKAILTDAATPTEEALARLKAYELPTDSVARVSFVDHASPDPLYLPLNLDALPGSRNISQSGCICMIDEGSMFVTGPSSAPLTASALRSSGQVQTIALDHMICLMVIENACVGTSSLEANHPSPTCCIRHLSSSGTTL